MNIVKHRKIFYSLSAILVILSIVFLSIWGLRWSIDFKGGSLIEVSYLEGRPSLEEVKSALSNIQVVESVRASGENGYIIRAKEIKTEQKDEIIKLLSFGGVKKIEEKSFNSIGPVMGKEAERKAYVSIILVIIAIVLFITFVFRKVSKPVASWKYGLVAIFALVHDVIIPTGFFSLMGRFYGYEIDTLFVTAILVILGFSVHDTIVVFDRVRENLRKNSELGTKKPFETIVGEGISQTLVRSINTSLTTLLALVALYIWGPESTQHFSLALFVGIVAGTYSSIFLGSPLLVTIEKWQKNKAVDKSVKR